MSSFSWRDEAPRFRWSGSLSFQSSRLLSRLVDLFDLTVKVSSSWAGELAFAATSAKIRAKSTMQLINGKSGSAGFYKHLLVMLEKKGKPEGRLAGESKWIL